MKLASSPHSFALLTFLLFSTQPIFGHLVHRNAGSLQPHLPGPCKTAASSSYAVSAGTARRRKSKCSGASTAAATGTYPTGTGLSVLFQNGSDTSTSGCAQSTITMTKEWTVTITVGSVASTTLSNAGNLPTNASPTTITSNISASLSDTEDPSTSDEGNGAVQNLAPVGSLFTNSTTSSSIGTGEKNDTSAPSTTLPTSGTSTASDVASSVPQSTWGNASTPTSPIAAVSAPTIGPGLNQSSSSQMESHNGELWAGAGIDTVPRARTLPGRTFYDFDEKSVKEPIDTLADAGVNAFRVQASRTDCLGPEPFASNASLLDDEDDFKLDFGCIDVKVKLAKQAIALGMRMQLTINQGLNIPTGMEKYSYGQMVEEVQKETKRQLQPFLDAKIVPDIILLENEGSDGFLFHEEATGHDRGSNDGKASQDVVNKEMCGQIPTGKMNSYPQLSGYYKAEVIACNEAITAAGFSNLAVRYGLHSHAQYVQWKESVVHGPKQASQTELKRIDGSPCDGSSPIPVDILAMNASEVLTIAGFSAYPDPMHPTDINSTASLQATLGRLEDTLSQIQGYSEGYGKYSSGPFAGQYKLQALGVEYATHFKYPDEISQQQTHTEMMWDLVRKFSATTIGMLWWEPWYCNNHWEGGQATLCHLLPGAPGSGILGEAPTNTLKTWGAAARSPWKNSSAGK